jgi:hypothetical protein
MGYIWRDHIGYAYVIYVWTWRMGWSIGVRCINLISVILRLYDGYGYVIIRSLMITLLYSIFVFLAEVYAILVSSLLLLSD